MTVLVSPTRSNAAAASQELKEAKVEDVHELYTGEVNPVMETSKWAVTEIDIVLPNREGIKAAAEIIHAKMQRESYVPRTWRTHPLHICPADPFSWDDPSTSACLNWIFFISSLNFSFWSELEGHSGRYGVEWREGWHRDRISVHTGYWSLVAAVDRALEEGISITDPMFYASKTRCPDTVIEHVFRAASQSVESIPLLHERIKILREVGSVLCSEYGGSFSGFVDTFRRRYHDRGTALQLVKMVTDTFPSFRDEHKLNGRRVYIWKRAQILVAETWAAFYPEDPSSPHPLFPAGAAIHELTMFADYRVPQILHHLRILSYPPPLVKLLNARTPLESGSVEELSIRTASIVAVELVREEILSIIIQSISASSSSSSGDGDGDGLREHDAVSSVMIDFYLWDLAKRVESGAHGVDSPHSATMMPIHRTRSIWY